MTKWYRRQDARHARRERPGCLFWTILGAAVLLLLVIGHRLWLPGIAQLLIVDQPPEEADAILILGGGDGSRCAKALELYRQGFAPMIITSGEKPDMPDFDTSRAQLSANYMMARGVPQETILLLPNTTSTHDEAVESRRIAEERGYHALLVVTDPFHTRRTYLAFRRTFRDAKIRFLVIASTPDWWDARSWWTRERSFLAVLEEIIKLAFYLYHDYI